MKLFSDGLFKIENNTSLNTVLLLISIDQRQSKINSHEIII